MTDMWNKIRLYRLCDDGTLKLLGERILERDEMDGRILKSIMEDTNTKNRGSFVTMRGWYISIYQNGINLDNTFSDRDNNPAYIEFAELIKNIGKEYEDFKEVEE